MVKRRNQVKLSAQDYGKTDPGLVVDHRAFEELLKQAYAHVSACST